LNNQWLTWAKELQSLSQAGLEFSKNDFDVERYKRIREISVDIISKHVLLENEFVRNLFANETGYQTPKIDIRAVVFKQEKILLVKEKLDGKWSLPGGYADIGLSVKENIIKEVKEEAGIDVRPIRVLAIHDRNKHVIDEFPYSAYKIFVECLYLKGEWIDNIETHDAKFFGIEGIPEISTGRVTKEQIKMCFEMEADKNIELQFD
jgi:ADP-ribose pyrophosphatase YjhB (NUDIX family)